MQVSLGDFNTNQFPTDSQLSSFIGGFQTFTLAVTAVMAYHLIVWELWWATSQGFGVCRRCCANVGGYLVRAALCLVCVAALQEPGPGSRHP